MGRLAALYTRHLDVYHHMAYEHYALERSLEAEVCDFRYSRY